MVNSQRFVQIVLNEHICDILGILSTLGEHPVEFLFSTIVTFWWDENTEFISKIRETLGVYNTQYDRSKNIISCIYCCLYHISFLTLVVIPQVYTVSTNPSTIKLTFQVQNQCFSQKDLLHSREIRSQKTYQLVSNYIVC